MELKILFKNKSQNRKLGKNTASSYTQKSTCPDACSLKNNGCYADGYPVALHWNNLDKESTSKSHYVWGKFLNELKGLTHGTFFRHNVAGDLPGTNNTIDRGMFRDLIDACRNIKGFTFTHKPVGWAAVGASAKDVQMIGSNTEAVREANKLARSGLGLTVNLSADSLEQADYLHSLNIGPVVSVVPIGSSRHMKTPGGRHVIVCPNEIDENLTCDNCRLCANPKRKAIVAFVAHGIRKNQVSKMVQNGKRSLPVMQ